MRSLILATFVILFSVFTCVAVAQTSSPKDQTVQDLQTAFNGESNAAARYKAFAEKADTEKLPAAASLFRAAARAEQIHAANHARVLKSMGVEATAKLEAPQVLTTQENLQAAIAGESQERDTMYPQMIKNARDAKLADAVKTFTQAKTAEAEHAKLYTAMLADIKGSPQQAKAQYLVCPVCGYTAKSINGKCPSCFTPREKFEVIG